MAEKPMGETEDLLRELLQGIKEYTAEQKKAFKGLSDYIQTGTTEYGVLIDEFEKLSPAAKELNEAAFGVFSEMDEVSDDLARIASETLTDQATLLGKIPTRAQFTKALTDKLKEEGVTVGKDTIGKMIGQTDLIIKRFNMIRKESNKLADDVMKPFDAIFGRLQKSKIGDMFVKWAGLDKVREETKKNISNILEKSLKKGGMKMKDFGAIAKEQFAGVGKAARAAFAHPIILAIALIIGAFYLAWKQWNKVIDAAKSLRDVTGMTGVKSKEIADGLEDVALRWTAIGGNIELAGKTTGALINQFQTADILTDGMKENALVLAAAFGVGEENAAKIVQLFKTMGVDSDKVAFNLQASIANAADLAGVGINKVFDDMATASKEIHTYFKGNVIEAAKAAIELRRMGTTLKEAAATAKSMVDFESSITAELEASVLLGRQLDFSAARYYAWTGDIKNQQKEILAQVGSIAEFNALIPFQKEAIAKAAGMEVDQLANMLNQRKLLSEMDSQQKRAYDKAIDQIGKMNTQTAESVVFEKQRLLAQEKFSKIWEAILFKVGQLFFPIFNKMYEIMDQVGTAFQKMFASGEGEKSLEELMKALGEMWDAVQKFIPPFMEIIKKILPIFLRHIRNILGYMTTGIQIITKLISGDLKGAMELIPKLFGGILKTIINGMALIPQLFLAMIDEALGTNLLGAVQSVIDWIGGAWEWLSDKILWPFKTLIGLFIDGFPAAMAHINATFIQPFIAAMDLIGLGFKMLWTYIDLVFIQPFKAAIGWITGAWDSVSGFFSDLFGGGTTKVEVKTPEGEPLDASGVPRTARGGVVTKPQIRMVGEAGPEGIIPLDRADEFKFDSQGIINKIDELAVKSDPTVITKKLDELIVAIQSMKLYMDHREVGGVLANNTSNPGLGG